MLAADTFFTLLWIWVGLAALIFALLFVVSAPYGRHARTGWGPRVPARLGWVAMEAASPLLMALLFAVGGRQHSVVAITFLALWELHYLHRAFIFPLRMPPGRPMPVLIALFALVFNLVNAYFNGRYLFSFAPPYPLDWLLDPRFVIGALMFVTGYAVNLHADTVLLRLKAEGRGYQIPRGGLYALISCPNYFGEVVEWTGWALATWSLPGLAFALWTAANLVPRARTHHRWYQERFPDYPARRKAIIPFVF